MKKKAGLWIDHKRAVIFSISNEGAEIKRITSDVKNSVRIAGSAQKESVEEHGDTQLSGYLDNYYKEVVDCICDAESILIFGPGEAKSELKKRLESKNLLGSIVGFETADTMTDNQIVAKVRQRFLK